MKNENACLRSEGEAESKQPKKKRERSLSWQNKHIVSRIFLGLFAAFVVFPIILAVLNSFKPIAAIQRNFLTFDPATFTLVGLHTCAVGVMHGCYQNPESFKTNLLPLQEAAGGLLYAGSFFVSANLVPIACERKFKFTLFRYFFSFSDYPYHSLENCSSIWSVSLHAGFCGSNLGTISMKMSTIFGSNCLPEHFLSS